MCKGQAHGAFELQTMPADSNLVNSAFAICNFCGLRQWYFVKKPGGWLPAWMWFSTPWLGVGFTSPVCKIEGNFCNKVFTSSGKESGNFLKEGGGSTGRGCWKYWVGGQGRWRQKNGGRGRCWTSKLYLADFWRNSDFEFFQKVTAQDGTGYCSLQKSWCKKFALKLHSFFK